MACLRFRISVYGISRRRRTLPVHRLPNLDLFAISGSGVEFGETFASAVFREFREETGLDVRPIRLLEVNESFFTNVCDNTHDALILYEVDQTGGKIEPKGNVPGSVEVRFVSLNDLLAGQILPVFDGFLQHLAAE